MHFLLLPSLRELDRSPKAVLVFIMLTWMIQAYSSRGQSEPSDPALTSESSVSPTLPVRPGKRVGQGPRRKRRTVEHLLYWCTYRAAPRPGDGSIHPEVVAYHMLRRAGLS